MKSLFIKGSIIILIELLMVTLFSKIIQFFEIGSLAQREIAKADAHTYKVDIGTKMHDKLNY